MNVRIGSFDMLFGILCRFVSCCVLCRFASFCIVSCRVVSYRMVLCRIMCRVVSYRVGTIINTSHEHFRLLSVVRYHVFIRSVCVALCCVLSHYITLYRSVSCPIMSHNIISHNILSSHHSTAHHVT